MRTSPPSTSRRGSMTGWPLCTRSTTTRSWAALSGTRRKRMSDRLSAREVKRHKWWGWGLDDVTFRYDNKPAFPKLAKNKVGVDLDSKQPVEPVLTDHEVPASRLPAETRAKLVAL